VAVAADAADAPRSAAEAASASSATAAPSGPHVRVTARPFADCAASVSPELAAHEVKIAKGYSLIFPPPDPSSIHPSVWEGNRALHAAAAANRAAAEEAAAKAKARARAGEDDAVEPGAAAVFPPPSTLPAPTPRETAELSAAWGGWSFAPDGVPRPFYRPWDVSLEACEARIARYRTLLDVSRELYAVETAAAATGGKRAAQAAVESTAPAFAAAAARAAASAAGESGPSEDGAAPGPEPPAPAAAQATFARLLRALATESAEKAKGAAAAAAAATGGGSTASAVAGARAFGAGRSTGAATPLAGRPSTTGLVGRRPGTVGTLPPSGAAAAATRPPRGEAGGAGSAGRRPGSGFARMAAAAAAAAAEGGASSTATLPRPMSGKSDGVGSVAESGVSSGGSETGGEGDGGGGSSAPGAAHRSLRRAASFTRGGGGAAAAAGGGVRTSPSLLVPVVVMLGSDELFPLPLAAAQPPQPEGRGGIAAAGPRKQPLRLSVSAFGASKVPSPSLPVTPLVVPGGGAFFPPSASGVAGMGGGALAAARALRAGMANGGGPAVPAVVPSPYLKRVRAKMLEAATRSIPAVGASEEATLWSEG
jgi:trimeric autotransporter adhesin